MSESLRKKILEFLESLKDGVTSKYENNEIVWLLDPAADYDMYAKQVGNSLTIYLYSRYARCIVRVYIDKNDNWRLRSVSCR